MFPHNAMQNFSTSSLNRLDPPPARGEQARNMPSAILHLLFYCILFDLYARLYIKVNHSACMGWHSEGFYLPSIFSSGQPFLSSVKALYESVFHNRSSPHTFSLKLLHIHLEFADHREINVFRMYANNEVGLPRSEIKGEHKCSPEQLSTL